MKRNAGDGKLDFRKSPFPEFIQIGIHSRMRKDQAGKGWISYPHPRKIFYGCQGQNKRIVSTGRASYLFLLSCNLAFFGRREATVCGGKRLNGYNK